jgi:DNA-binding CsgD family transcriptional regulator
MELLERAGAMAQVDAALREAAAGAGRIVLVAGEAGVGKTALVDAVARATDTRARFLWGACDPLLTPRALGPIHDVARQTDGGGLAEAIGAGAAREAVFAALLDELSGRPPTVLVVEDLHWADEATLDALAVIGRRIRHTTGTLLLTYRSDEIALHPDAVALLGALPADAVRRVEPAPLSVAAVAELARRAGRDPAGLHAATGGNAFFVTEVLAAVAPGVPASVREVVTARVARLSAASRALAETVSVVPTRAEPWLLQEAVGAEPAALDECVAAGLLTAGVDGVAFRHDLARAAVAAGLPPSRRRALNARVLAALRTRGGVDPARLAHHARAAGDWEAILRHAGDAAHAAAALHANAQALDHAEAALAAAAELGVDRTALLEQVSSAAYLCGRSERALAARRELLALHEAAGRPAETGDTLRWLARLEWFSGNGPAADRAARRAIAVLEPLGPSARLAMARSTLAQLHMLAWRNREAIETGSRAADLAREVGDEEALAHALTNVGSALLWEGRPEEGRALIEEAFARATAAGLPEHAVRALVNVAYAVLAFEAGDAGAAIERALAFAREHDLSGYVQYLLGIRAMYGLRQGRWTAAEADARESMNMGRHPGVSPCPALIALGLVQGRRGEASAAATLEDAWERSQATGELQRLAPAAAARLEIAWLAGDPGPALDDARAIHARCVGVADPWTLGELEFGLRRAGAPPTESGAIAEPYRRALAGDWRGAAAQWDELGRPYEAAEARAEGDDEAALLEALATFDRLGAAPAAARVRRRLRERGAARVPRGPRPATRALPAGLTPRQHEVLRLLVTGATNAEIAERLVLSPKTVDHHVSAVLAKLGVTSRREAAGAARRLGLDGSQDGEPAAPTWEAPPDAGSAPRA